MWVGNFYNKKIQRENVEAKGQGGGFTALNNREEVQKSGQKAPLPLQPKQENDHRAE